MTLVGAIVALSSVSANIVSASTIDPKRPHSRAKRKAAPMSTDTVNQKVPTGTWVVDPIHSSVAFSVTHNNVATYRSKFDSYDVTLTGGDEPKLVGTVDVDSIDIDEA